MALGLGPVAAGAHGALQELLARRFQEQLLTRQQGERERSAQSAEGLKGRELEELGKHRGLQQDMLERERVRDETYRRDALGQQAALADLTRTAQAERAKDRLTQQGEALAQRKAQAEAALALQRQLGIGNMELRRELGEGRLADQQERTAQRKTAIDPIKLIRYQGLVKHEDQVLDTMLRDAGNDPTAQQKAHDIYGQRLKSLQEEFFGQGQKAAAPSNQPVIFNGYRFPTQAALDAYKKAAGIQ